MKRIKNIGVVVMLLASLHVFAKKLGTEPTGT